MIQDKPMAPSDSDIQITHHTSPDKAEITGLIEKLKRSDDQNLDRSQQSHGEVQGCQRVIR